MGSVQAIDVLDAPYEIEAFGATSRVRPIMGCEHDETYDGYWNRSLASKWHGTGGGCHFRGTNIITFFLHHLS